MTAHTELLGAYFDRAITSFRDAGAHSRSESSSYTIAGFPVTLQFAGDGLPDKLPPALQHVKRPRADNQALTVFAWDTVSTGVALDPPPWEGLSFVERGLRRIYADEQFVLIYDRRTSVFNMIDLRSGEAVYWLQDGSWLPYYELAAPMRYLFQGWLHSRGLFVSHASALGYPDGGVLLAGPTGSGKSTTSLLSLSSDLRFAGDDYIVIRTQPEPAAFSLYNSAKINASDLESFPDLRPYVANRDQLRVEKALLFLAESFPERVIESFPLKVILLPRVGSDTQTHIEQMSPADAFKRLGPDTVFTMLGNAQLIFRGLRELTQALPCYDLVLGSDRRDTTDVIRQVLQSVREPL